jgi:Carboxypeptidase regulatory-like domain
MYYSDLRGRCLCRKLAGVFILFVVCLTPARAQVGANVGGTVSDSSGGTVAGATVTITNTSNGVSQALTTGPGGNYRAVNLQPAPYVITVTSNGFETQKKSLTLVVGTDLTVDFTLTVGQVQQEVNVSEAATTIEVTQSQPASVISDQQIDNLPVLNRDFLVIAQTMPGSTTMTNMGVYPAFNVTKFGGVADQRSGNTTILDGAPIDDPIWGSPVINMSQDAIQEFKVYRDQFDAQYGYSMNAVVTVATKTGGDQFHGTGYYFGRDQALDAINALATTKPPYSLWRAGGTFGGPVKSNNTHFFFGYEHLNINTAVVEALPPNNPFAPEENGNYPFTETETLIDARVDHRFSKSDSMWVRYAYDYHVTPTGGPPNYANNMDNFTKSHSLVAENDWMISPTKVNTLGFIYMNQNLYSLQTDPGAVAILRPSFYFGGNVDDPQYFPRQDYTVYDTFFLTLPKHSMKFGGGIKRTSNSYGAHFYQYGQWTFTTDEPFNKADPATWPVLLQLETPGNFGYASNVPWFFFQDDISVTKRLHFNVGLRYDFDSNLRDNGFYNGLLKNPEFAGIDNFVSSDRGNEYHNIQPRLGVAFDLLGNGKVQLRAGFGKYVTRNRPWLQEENEQSTIGAGVFITDPTQLSNYPDITAALGGKTLAQYVAAGGPRSIGIIDNNFKVPYSNNFTGGFSWQLNSRTVLDVDGVFDKSHDEWAGKDLNLPNGVLSPTNPRPVPQFSNVTDITNFGWASFNAFEAQLRTRTKGFDTIYVSYTYSQSLIDAATFYGTYLFPNNYAYNPTNTPQNLSVSFTTSLIPKAGIRLSGIYSYVSGPPYPVNAGISLDGHQNSASQLPAGLQQTVGDGDTTGQLQIINAFRADPCAFVVAGAPCTTKPLSPISASQLKLQPINNLNLRVMKDFSFRERNHLQLFMESYNVFNHVTKYLGGGGFGGESTMVSPSFLILDQALDPRLFQWGARFIF